MAIRVSCSKCGTVLDVPEQAAGNAVPCPACQMKVFVPGLPGGSGGTPAAARPTGGQAAPQQPAFRQPPQRNQPGMPAPNVRAPNPRPMEMPSAGPSAYQTYGVTSQSPPPLGAAPAYPAAGQPGPWMQQPQFGAPQFGPPQFGSPTVQNYSPRRSRGFFGSPWVLTLITLLCLGGVALLVWWLFFSKGEAEVAWLPDNPDVVAQIHVKELLDSGFVRDIERAFPQFSRENLKNLPDAPPVDVAKIAESVDRIVIGGKIDGNAVLAVAYLNRDLDIKGLIEQAGAGGIGAGGVQEQKVAGYTMYVANEAAWCEVEDKVIVFGPPAELQKVLERGPEPDIGSRVEDAMGNVDYDQTIAVAMAAPAGEDTEGMKAVYASADVGDSLEFSLTLECDSSAMAAQIAQGASAAGPAIRQFAGSGVEDYEADRSGNAVTISATIHSSVIEELQKNAGQFFGPGFNPEQLFQGL